MWWFGFFRLVTIALVFGFATPLVAGSPDCGPQLAIQNLPRSLDFLVTRAGKPIGRYGLRFERRGGDLRVFGRSHVEIRLAFLRLYSLEHRSTETWRSGRLVSLTSRTNEDGEYREVNYRSAWTDCALHEDPPAVGSYSSGSFWSAFMVHRDWVIDPVKGERTKVESAYLGRERLALGGGALQAHRYRLAGSDERELWFDSHGLLAKMRLRVKDGSTVELLRLPGLTMGDARSTLPSGGAPTGP